VLILSVYNFLHVPVSGRSRLILCIAYFHTIMRQDIEMLRMHYALSKSTLN